MGKHFLHFPGLVLPQSCTTTTQMNRFCWNFPNKHTFVLRQLWKISTSSICFGKGGAGLIGRGGSARVLLPPCVPLGACWWASVQANFTARVFSADLKLVEDKRRVGRAKDFRKDFDRTTCSNWQMKSAGLETRNLLKIASHKCWIWRSISKTYQINSRTSVSSGNISKLHIT